MAPRRRVPPKMTSSIFPAARNWRALVSPSTHRTASDRFDLPEPLGPTTQDNAASRALHTKCGFRLVGRRERIARDCHGRWLDTFLMEYRAAANEPEGYKKL